MMASLEIVKSSKHHFALNQSHPTGEETVLYKVPFEGRAIGKVDLISNEENAEHC